MWVSMVLTLKAHRRSTPKKNRRIPTIPAGRFDARLVNVSAVDTGPRRSESPGFVRQSPVPPSQVLLHRSLPAVCAESRQSWFDSGPTQNWLEMARVGLLHEGRDPLAKGCAYCTKAPPTQSAPNPPPVAPHPRAVRARRRQQPPERPGQPLRQVETAALPSLSHLADPPNRCLEMS